MYVMRVPYRKMHGTGNLILIVDQRATQLPVPDAEKLRQLASETSGPGFDQLMSEFLARARLLQHHRHRIVCNRICCICNLKQAVAHEIIAREPLLHQLCQAFAFIVVANRSCRLHRCRFF